VETTHLIRAFAAAALAVLLLSAVPVQSWAAVNCATVTSSTTTDSDSDGFTDFQECNGITLVDGTSFPSCVYPTAIANRRTCVHPDSKDLFVIVAPAATGSLLRADYAPFTGPTYYGITFHPLDDLGVTVHQITPGQAGSDRSVPSGYTQKAVKVSESLDTSGTILGYCQWGTPTGLDGCTVYTQRIVNFITSTCGTNAIVTAGGTPTTANDLFLAYATHTFLHETGHTTGGMTGVYNSSYGGYHYKCGAGTRMEQCVTSSVKGGNCKFNFSSGWNGTTDSSTIQLK